MTKARDIASATPAPSTVSATELGYLDGVTSAIQTQIDSKIGSASAINPTIVDAKGDLIVGSAADTVARLAVGTNNHVLTADSAATNGVKWAAASSGGMTLLSTTSISGTTTTISGINQTYKELMVYVLNLQPAGFTSDVLFGLNGTGFSGKKGLINWALSSGTYGQNQLNHTYLTRASGNLQQNQNVNNWYVSIPNYASTTTEKMFSFFGSYTLPTANATVNGVGYSDSTSAITSIAISLDGSISITSGTVLIYGVN